MTRKALDRCSRLNSSKDISEVKGIVEQDSNEDSMLQLPGIPLAPSSENMNPGVTFVLEKASLVPAYVGKVTPFFIYKSTCILYFSASMLLCSLLFFYLVFIFPFFRNTRF